MRGDKVRITGGLFEGQLGLYEGMRPKDRVEVLLSMLGSERKVLLDRGHIARME